MKSEIHKKERRKGLSVGKKGESLFWKPFVIMLQENELQALSKKVEGMNDHRLLAIITALLIENRIDKINSAFLPKYSKLTEINEFTFSIKIRLTEAMNFIPPLITRTAHCLREIRNEFAHNLEKKSLIDLDKKFIQKMSLIYNEFISGKELNKNTEDSIFALFKTLSFFCLSCLDVYVPTITILRQEISKDEFIDNLGKIVDEMNNSYFVQITSKTPISIEDTGKLKIEKYEKGVIVLSSTDQRKGTK